MAEGAKSIHERENDLFARWKEHVSGDETEASSMGEFVSDGMVDEGAFRSNPMILLLLKEVNDLGGGGWDLRETLRNYREFDRTQTWLNIARWVKGLQNIYAGGEGLDWKTDLEEISTEDREDLLRSIVAMNLKKFPGSHTADAKDFWTHVERDQEFIRRQIGLYRADITIFCGSIVGDAYKHIFGNEIEWRQTSRGIWHAEHNQGHVIYYAHPEARVQDSLLHYALIDAVREVCL